MKLSPAQKKMVARLNSGMYIIGYGRNWYNVHNGQHIFMGHKANDSTIEALLAGGVLIERGTPDQVDYRVLPADANN